jgi:photosystem II stability/assembly factor-like uncharacterized protein
MSVKLGRQMITQLRTRGYYQLGQAGPNSPVYYAEPGELDLTGISLPVNGGVSYTKVKGDNLNEWISVAEIIEAPGEIAGSAVFRFKRGGIPNMLLKTRSKNSFYIYSGDCGDLSKPNLSWSDWVIILANGIVGEVSLGDMVTMAGTDMLQLEVPHTFSGIYLCGAINFGLSAGTNITAEAMDVTYGMTTSNGDCTAENDGSRHIYVLAQTATTPEVVYSTNKGGTWTDSAISVAATAEAPTALDIMQDYLLVISPTAASATAGGHYYAAINSDTGVPGTWAKVTTGYITASEPRDVFVADRNLAVVVGDGGYIYKLTSPLNGATVLDAGNATTSDLKRVHGKEDVFVAVGGSGTVVKSTSRGQTWGVVTAITGTPALNCIQVVGEKRFWVGADTGLLFYTEDGGTTWTQINFDGSGTGSVTDLVFVNSHVGYLVHTVGSTSRILWTLDAGQSWVLPTQGNRVKNFPAAAAVQRINRLAYPTKGDTIVSCNNLVGAGLGATTDGVFVIGVPTVV